jgi:hypothetical protein
LLPAAATDAYLAEGFRGFKTERSAKLGGGVAQQAALHCRRLSGQPDCVDGDGAVRRAGAATSADWTASQEQLLGEAGDFGIPKGLFVAGQFGHVGEMLADTGIPLLQFWQKLVAQTVACVGMVLIRGVFAPGLMESGEIGFDLGTGDGQHWAENAPFWKLDDGMNAGEPFGPGAAQKLAEDGFGLVIESVRRRDRIDPTSGHEFAKPGVAKPAAGFFDGFVMLGGLIDRVNGMGVELDAERLRQIGGKLLIEIGFLAAQTVMEVGDVQDDAEIHGAGGKSSCQCYGICPAGQADGHTQARF